MFSLFNLIHLITDLPHLFLIYSSFHFVTQTLCFSHYLICFLSLNKDSSSNRLEFSIPNSNSFWYDSTLQNPITNPLCSYSTHPNPLNPPIITTHWKKSSSRRWLDPTSMKKVAPIVLNPGQKDNHLGKTDVAKSCLLIPLGHLSQPKISHSKISLGSFKLYGKFIAHIWLMEIENL